MRGLGAERVRISFRRERRGTTLVNVLEWLRIRDPRDLDDRAAFQVLARDAVGKDQDEADRIFHAHRQAGSALWRPSREGEG